MTSAGKQNLNRLRNAPENCSTMFYTSQSKEVVQGGYKKSIGDGLGRWEKAQWRAGISGIG